MRSWLQFFRLPNLPTAPGDALAGAAFFMPLGDEHVPQMFAAAFAALCLYMFGLADNDIVGARTDADRAADRPIPRGDLSLPAARSARGICFFLAFAVPVWTLRSVLGGQLPPGWVAAAAVLSLCILAYNRFKGLWLMGLCRGLSVVCGALAVWTPQLNDATSRRLLVALALLALGWTLYIAAVTKLSDGEERNSAGLGVSRYLLGLAAFAPLAAFLPVLGAPDLAFESAFPAVLPVLGCLFAFMSWCAAVAPLGAPHAPGIRRRAVGRTIGALLFLQVGFMLVVPRIPLLAAAAVLWFGARFARRIAPRITGS